MLVSTADPVVPGLPGDSDQEKENNASSCFANPLSLCMSRKIPAGWTNLKNGESKVLKGTGLSTRIVSFFYSHYTVKSVFTTMTRSSKVVVLGTPVSRVKSPVLGPSNHPNLLLTLTFLVTYTTLPHFVKTLH